MTIEGILENIVADIVILLLAILLGWLWVTLTKRRKLQQFFATSASKRLVVYLSNLRVMTFGAVGISGRRMSYQGSSVAHGEMQGANRIRDLFSFIIPSITDSSSALRRVLLSDVLVQVLISPLTTNELEADAPFVSLGSPAYNVASRYIEDECGSIARFRFGVLRKSEIEDGPQIIRGTAYSTDTEVHVVPSGTAWADPTQFTPSQADKDEPEDTTSAILVSGVPPITDPTYGFVERVADEAQSRVVFYVAGLSEHATTGSAQFLSSRWSVLRRKYGNERPFLVMLQFDPEDTTRWSIVFERDPAAGD